jgi:hypothetical protein
MTPIEAGETILKCLDYINQQYESNYELINELDKQLCDIQHTIEFTALDIQRGYKLAKQLQDIRKRRRIAKDENELLYHMHDYLNAGTSKHFIVGFTSNLGKAKRRSEQLQDREYYPRSQAFCQEGGMKC